MTTLNKIKKEVLEKEKNRKEIPEEERVPLEKGDILAMLISGFITIFLPCMAIIGFIVWITLYLFT